MVSAIPSQYCNLSEFRSTTTQLVRLNDLPLGLPVYPPLSTEADRSVSSERARELGTLHPTLDRPSTFYPWSLISFPIRQEPSTTLRSSNGPTTFRLPKSVRRFATLSRIAAFQVSVTDLPSHPTLHRTFTLNLAPNTIRLVTALGCLTSDSATFPITPTTDQRHCKA